jgi:hypothetical protein
MANYSQITQKRIQARLHKRYQTEMAALQTLGFQHLADCLEEMGPFSAISNFLIIPPALLNKEILLIIWPFRLAVANVLLSIMNPPSIALCMGMGIKFYTGFYDGTVIISSDFESRLVSRAEAKVVRLPHRPTLKETWSYHKAEVLRRSEKMSFIAEKITFGDYVLMSRFEEDPSQYEFK